MGTAQNRVLQDRRRLSRISVQMECRFKSNDDKEYGALMLDLSQGGTLLSSTLPSQESFPAWGSPPDEEEFFPVKEEDFPNKESKISITFETGGLKVPMTLKGTIRRSTVGMSEYGKVAQLGVEFENTPLELLRLISILSRRKTSRVSTKIECGFRSGDNEYAARIIDLSSEGALISSAFIPAKTSKVFITPQADGLEAPMTIEGTVTHCKAPVEGENGQFGVKFDNPTLELLQFISTLSAGRYKKTSR
jgi:hypothetical protein